MLGLVAKALELGEPREQAAFGGGGRGRGLPVDSALAAFKFWNQLLSMVIVATIVTTTTLLLLL